MPGIAEQAKAGGFQVDFYDFRKAKTPNLDYFNPALVRREDGMWLVTRRSEIRPNLKYGFNDLMAFKLDDQHLPQFGKPLAMERVSSEEHFEDPRAVRYRGAWWLSVCNFVIYSGSRTWTGAHQIFLEINDDWQVTRRHDPVYGKNSSSLFEQKGDEKNWLWFEHEGELFMIYKTHPHTVVHFDERIIATGESKTYWWLADWKWGEPRGGSAPVRFGGLYWCFFHSSTPWKDGKRQYHMGAYCFRAEPPFEVVAVTEEPLLSGSQEDPWAAGKPLVVFPCAALLDGNRLDWTVSLGVNDLVSARATISHPVLESKLSTEITEIRTKESLSNDRIVYA